jgi:hypothetical protein
VIEDDGAPSTRPPPAEHDQELLGQTSRGADLEAVDTDDYF